MLNGAQTARLYLQKLIWITISILVLAYTAGLTYVGVLYWRNISESTQIKIQSQLQEQSSEIVTEVMLDQNTAIANRLKDMEARLNMEPHIKDLCLHMWLYQSGHALKTCVNSAQNTKRLLLPVNAGSHKLGEIIVTYTFTDFFPEIFIAIVPSLALVILLAIAIIFAIFNHAERKIIGPFAEEIRNSEQQAATKKAVRMMAHDVRRPFSMMSIMLSEIKQASSVEDVSRLTERYLPTVELSLNQITEQLNQFLKTNDAQETVVLTSMNEIISSAVKNVQFIFPNHRKPEVVFDKRYPAVQCHPQNMQRAFENILANAFEACGVSGFVSIFIHSDQDDVIIRFSNNGPAIPGEDLKQIFSETYTKGKIQGTGLGLAIVHRIVEETQGTIRCKNLNPKGVEFTIRLPKSDLISNQLKTVTKPILQSNAEPRLVSRKTDPFRILIIEDELIYQDAILKCIERLNTKGFSLEPMIAETSTQAIALFHEWQPTAIICDQMLGNEAITGTELVQRFQSITPQTSILLISNGILDTSNFQSPCLKWISTTQKPISIEVFEVFVQKALSMYAGMRTRRSH